MRWTVSLKLQKCEYQAVLKVPAGSLLLCLHAVNMAALPSLVGVGPVT